MIFKKSIVYLLLTLSKKKFIENTYKVLLFAFTIVIIKIVEVSYKIMNLSYLLIIILFFVGLVLYELFEKILYNRKLKLTFIVFLFMFLSIVIAIRYKYVIISLKNLLTYYSDIQYSFYHSKQTYFYQYVPFLIILVPALTAVTLYLNSKGLGNIVLVISIIFIFNIWYAAELIEVKSYMLIYSILCLFTYSHNLYINSMEKYKSEGIKISADKSKILKYVIIMSLTIGVLSYISVELFGVKSAGVLTSEWLSKSEKLKKKSLDNRYDLSFSGFLDDDKKLGGPVKLSNDRILKVKADKPYYLKGIVKDFYDGFKWSRIQENYERMEDGISIFASNSLLRYFQLSPPVVEYMTIYPDSLKTSTIFTPSFTFNVNLQKGYLGYDDSGSFTILGASEVKNPYMISFYKSKFGIDLFTNSYKNNILIDYSGIGEIYILNKYEKYLQLPENISPDIYELVNKITRDCRTPSDKVKSIENYLSKNYRYSLDVSKVPEGKEFIEYFLFDERKGYCTYFATAATVMLRIAGIPARYVEGFNMSDKKDIDGLYEVTSDMAHAWTEVLLYPEEDVWSIVDCVPEAEIEGYRKSKDYKDRLGSAVYWKNNKRNSLLDLSGVSILKIFVFWGLFLILLFAIIYSLIKIILFIKIKNKIINSNSSISLYKYVKNRFSCLYSNENLDDDTLWINRIDDSELKEMVSDLISATYKEFYGKKKSNETDKFKVYLYVENYIKLRQSKFKYYTHKLIRHKPLL